MSAGSREEGPHHRGEGWRFQRLEPAVFGSVAFGRLLGRSTRSVLTTFSFSPPRLGCMIQQSAMRRDFPASERSGSDSDCGLGVSRRRASQRRMAGLPTRVYAVLHWRLSHQSARRRSIAERDWPNLNRARLPELSWCGHGLEVRLLVCPPIFPAIRKRVIGRRRRSGATFF